MKQMIKYTLAIATMLLVTFGAFAGGNATIIYKLDGATSSAGGTVTYSSGTITVTPNNGYYLEAADLTVYKTINGQHAQTRNNPSINAKLEVTASDPNADPSTTTVYTFTPLEDANYDYEITANFHQRISLTDATVTTNGGTSFVYTSEPILPEVTVVKNSTTLTKDVDYKAFYKAETATGTITTDSINAGAKQIWVYGKGKYINQASIAYYTIEKASLTTVTLAQTEPTYNGEEQTVGISSVKAGDLVVSDEWYEIDNSYPNKGTNVGDYTVKVNAKNVANNNFQGEATTTFEIKPKSIAETTITLTQESFVYNGQNQKPDVTEVKDGQRALVLDQDYTITANEGGTNAGEYAVTIAGKGNYNSQTSAIKNFNITALETTPTVTLAETSFVYNGTERKPGVTVTVVLTQGANPIELTTDDYDVAYSDNVNVGENMAKATVTLKRNYVGQNTATFSITPKSIANVTISDIEDQTYTGNAIQPTVVVKDGENTLEKETDYTVSYSDNVNAALSTATEHAPTVIITGKGNYDSQTTAKKTFTIGKADPMLEFSPAETSITIGKESEFTKPKLTTTPEGLSVTYASMNTEIATVNVSTGDITPVAAGETEITATFAGNDNYNDGIAHYLLTVNPKTADLKYSAESVEITYGEEWTQPTLTNPDNLEITYASSNTQVATVSEAGVVTIVAAGETEISATSGDTKASYHLTVKLANPELLWVDDDQEVAEGMSYYIGDYFYGPKLKNPHQVKVKYDSDDKKVATIDPETGVIKVVGPGDTKIKAIFESDGRYSSQTVYFVLVVKEKYNLWVGSTQVSSENHKDILGDGHFFFDEESKWLVITSNTEPKVIESRMSDLTIYINGGSKLERIWFNNEGNAENTGKLYFTSYMNIPGSIDFSTSDANGVISGFSSIGLDEDAFLYLLDPTDGSYTGGKLVTKDGTTAQVATIGQYLKPLANGSTVTFPSGKYDTEDLTNKVIDNILNTLIQHTGDSDEDDDYFDSAESAIILNNLNTTSGITLLMDNIEKGELIPGSEEYAVKFRGGLTFMVPDGEGTITLNVKTEAGYKLMLMIGQSEPKEIVQTEQGEVSFDYNVEKPTYCCLYLVQDAATSRGTRIGKRDKHHGSIQSVRVLAQKSSLNPLGEISGFPDSKTPEVEIGSEETTGIKEIKIDNTTNDPVSDDNRWFDMQGRQIEKPTKAGIYIQNRKKIVIR